MKFSRWVFRIAGIYGLIVLVPQYFMEGRMGADYPPAITHPEYYYGFLGVGVAWQIAFLDHVERSAAISADDSAGHFGKVQFRHRRERAVFSGSRRRE